MTTRIFFVVLAALMLISCDGDGCNGGVNGPASKSCQQYLAGHPDVDAGDICARCCLQDVPYKGVIENGLCVCR